MNSKPIVWILASTLLIFTSCVAKKKYLAMEAGRLNAELQVRDLTAENNAKKQRIEAMIIDFEELKNELLESNAIKDQYITTLNNEISTLQSNVSLTTETLEEKDYAFEFEKRRLNNTITERDTKIRQLENELESWKNTAFNQSSEIDSKNFELRQEKDKVTLLEGEKNVQQLKIENLDSALKTIQDEISNLNSQIKEKDAEILKLKNNVKVLKGEIGN
ncbi:MAG: hypothetical protein HQ541_04175 [Mariniphaga sp.]|nr:hypothetical protein [Mariniphaga sp.]